MSAEAPKLSEDTEKLITDDKLAMLGERFAGLQITRRARQTTELETGIVEASERGEEQGRIKNSEEE